MCLYSGLKRISSLSEGTDIHCVSGPHACTHVVSFVCLTTHHIPAGLFVIFKVDVHLVLWSVAVGNKSEQVENKVFAERI